MPCRDYGYDESPAQARQEKQLRDRNDELARFACMFATVLESYVMPSDLLESLEKVSPKYATAALAWWKKHKADDAAEQARIAKKAAVKKKGQAVLKKLTDEEREALEAIGVVIPTVPLLSKKKVAVKKAK